MKPMRNKTKEQGCTNIFKFIYSKSIFAHFCIPIVRRIFDEGREYLKFVRRIILVHKYSYH